MSKVICKGPHRCCKPAFVIASTSALIRILSQANTHIIVASRWGSGSHFKKRRGPQESAPKQHLDRLIRFAQLILVPAHRHTTHAVRDMCRQMPHLYAMSAFNALNDAARGVVPKKKWGTPETRLRQRF